MLKHATYCNVIEPYRLQLQGADYVWKHNLNDYYFMSILIYVM